MQLRRELPPATAALAVVISQSTGRVSLFKAGKPILVLDKPKG
jgi:DNA integrity scanning protein DisA with diadenylate cyclase activity